jgi:hypothetical protein
MLRVDPKMLDRPAEIETDLHARRKRAESRTSGSGGRHRKQAGGNPGTAPHTDHIAHRIKPAHSRRYPSPRT